MSTKTTDILFDLAQLSDRALSVLGDCEPWGTSPGQALCEMEVARELEGFAFVRVLPGRAGWDAMVVADSRRGMSAAKYAQALCLGKARGRSAA